MNLIDIARQISQDTPSWASKQIGDFNGNQVNVRFMHKNITKWHVHSETDEMFFVLSGSITIETDDASFPLSQNDFFVVKSGLRHRARVDDSVMLMTIISKNLSGNNLS